MRKFHCSTGFVFGFALMVLCAMVHPAQGEAGSEASFLAGYGDSTAFPEAATGTCASPTDRCDRPTPMGVSTGTTPSSPFIFAGTAGMRVRSLMNPNQKFILSNNHVLGAIGPTLCPDTAPIGTAVLQPGNLDIGFDPGPDPFYVVGNLAAKIALKFSAGSINLIDSAIASTTTADADTMILGIGNPAPSVAFAAPGDAVVKAGRTTGVTSGTVASVNGSFNVNYGAGCGTARFIRQVEVTPGSFSSGGDSGSAILNSASRAPVALLFAGSSQSTIGNPMIFVYILLRVFVDGPSSVSSLNDVIREYDSMQKDPRMGRLMEIQAREEPAIFRHRGVVGMSIGLAQNGEDLAFRVYVKAMTPELRGSLPRQLDGVPVRVIESGEFNAYDW
ncbi:MAG: hypothetical protein ACE5JX_03015 [Acidobacteriota bacterium]